MMLQAGAVAPEVSLLSLNGEAFVLTEALKKTAVILVFFKISCPTCQFTLPFFERLYRAETPESARIVGISQDDEKKTREFSRHFELSFPTLLDMARQDYPVSNAYGITNVPSTFLVERDGRIGLSLNGFSKAQLEDVGLRHFGRSPFAREERVPAMRPG